MKIMLDYVSDYVDQEFRAKLDIKWPDKAKQVYELFHIMDFHAKDIPVLSDALYHKIDMILT